MGRHGDIERSGGDGGMAKVLPDEYTLRARLAPGLLAMFPAALDVLVVVPSVQTWWQKGATFLISLGLWVVPASWIGDRGRARQAAMWQGWGGAPTTTALRWGSATNKVALGTRHANVTRATGVTLPDEAAEAQDPAAADETYEAAVEVLREATRDKVKFPAVAEANADYGFRRNSYGIRGLAMSIAGIAAVVAAVLLVVGIASSAVSWKWALLALVVNVVLLLWWWRGVTKAAVRAAGARYADRLLAGASQVGDAPTSKPKKAKKKDR
jgi:hypothetical protein